jgi:hypothetical protein
MTPQTFTFASSPFWPNPNASGRVEPRLTARTAIPMPDWNLAYVSHRLCTNCARIQRFHSVRVILERKADSPICWKR